MTRRFIKVITTIEGHPWGVLKSEAYPKNIVPVKKLTFIIYQTTGNMCPNGLQVTKTTAFSGMWVLIR